MPEKKILNPDHVFNRVLEENQPKGHNWQHISEPVGRLIDDMRGLVTPAAPKYSAETLEDMRLLWEAGELSTTLIGERFGVSKNAVIGLAHRNGWSAKAGRKAERGPRTIFARLDELNLALDIVLAENLGVSRRPGE